MSTPITSRTPLGCDRRSADAFTATRTARDATLAMPAPILPSVQVNIRAGQMPEPDSHGRRFLNLPLNGF